MKTEIIAPSGVFTVGEFKKILSNVSDHLKMYTLGKNDYTAIVVIYDDRIEIGDSRDIDEDIDE